MMTANDFRIRRAPKGFRVFQRVGSGWEAMSDIHPTRAEARAWIASVTPASWT
jgi:hypothetical protein